MTKPGKGKSYPRRAQRDVGKANRRILADKIRAINQRLIAVESRYATLAAGHKELIVRLLELDNLS